MPDPNRLIGGVRCRELMPLLPDLIDGKLSTLVAERVKEHIGGCNDCAAFGKRYGALVSALRARTQDEPLEEGIRVRLMRKLESTWNEDSPGA